MTFEQGDLVLLPFPYTDLTAVKQRPALILSGDEFNRRSQDCIACGLTSNLDNTPHSVAVDSPDLVSGTLLRPSLIKANHIFTFDQGLIRKKFGKVRSDIVQRVVEVLLSILNAI